MLALATRATEGDIQGAQVGMQTSVLNGQNVGISAGFIVVRMPIPRRSYEGGSGSPVLPMPVANHSVVIELCTDQGVAAGFAGHCEIQGDRLVSMRALNLPRRKNAEHGPQGMGHGSCLRECIVAKQHTYTVGICTPGIAGDGVQFSPGVMVAVKARLKDRFHGADAEIPQQRSVMHPVQTGS